MAPRAVAFSSRRRPRTPGRGPSGGGEGKATRIRPDKQATRALTSFREQDCCLPERFNEEANGQMCLPARNVKLSMCFVVVFTRMEGQSRREVLLEDATRCGLAKL